MARAPTSVKFDSTITILSNDGFVGAVRWLVKHYLNELKPNGGSSVKDSIARLETKVEILYQIMIQDGKK
jgi:hypothetical protein